MYLQEGDEQRRIREERHAKGNVGHFNEGGDVMNDAGGILWLDGCVL